MSIAIVNLQMVYEQDLGDLSLDNSEIRKMLEGLQCEVWKTTINKAEGITIKEVKVSMRDKQENQKFN